MSPGRGPKLLPGTRTTRRAEPRRKKRESRRSRPAGFGSRRPCAGSPRDGPAPCRAVWIVRGSRDKRRPPPPRRSCLRRSACRTRRQNHHWEIAAASARWLAVWDKLPTENFRPPTDEEPASPAGQGPRARRPVPTSDPRRERYAGEQSRPFAGVFLLRVFGREKKSGNTQKTSAPERILQPPADDWPIPGLGAFRDHPAGG